MKASNTTKNVTNNGIKSAAKNEVKSVANNGIKNVTKVQAKSAGQKKAPEKGAKGKKANDGGLGHFLAGLKF